MPDTPLQELYFMSDEVVIRKLAAILAADVAGYTRLMETNENTTLENWWSARREIIDPGIERHGGRIVKHTGDGFLAEFSTATEAITCAWEMQTALAETNVGRKKDERFDFRMGVNVGEIVVDKEDIYGDGVNIAARLESLADNGGITISALAYEQVKNRLDLEFEDLGNKKLKHVGEPVRHYRVLLDSSEPRKRSLFRLGPVTPLRFIGAVALVLLALAFFSPGGAPSRNVVKGPPVVTLQPFRTIGESKLHTSFTDGLTEDLMTALTSSGDMKVLIREDGSGAGLKSIKAGYRLEGSVRTVGERVRISAQLVDPSTGLHLWGGRYDRDLKDVLNVQTEVSGKIVSTLKEKVLTVEQELAATDASVGGRARDVLFRGLSNLGRIAEAAAFLPLDIIDWVSGPDNEDLSVEGRGRGPAPHQYQQTVSKTASEDWV